MAHNTTVIRQLLDLLPRHEFAAEARQHQEGQRLRVMSRWAQFVALGLGQLGGLQSLRDIVGNLRAQPHKLYHLGVRAFVSRSSLARVNAQQPYALYEALFGRLLARCQQRAPRHGFRFKNKLYAVDASTIDLCLAAFPWASFRRTKGAIKLHVGLDQAGHLPTFISVTDGKTGDVTVARTWTFPAGSVVGYSGGSGTRNPEEVEQRFRRKWNSESGKWNTESGGSGTSIPEEVEQRFRRS